MATFLIPPRQQNFYICEINFAYLVNFLFFFLLLMLFLYLHWDLAGKLNFYLQLTSFYGPYDAIAIAGKLLVNLKGH